METAYQNARWNRIALWTVCLTTVGALLSVELFMGGPEESVKNLGEPASLLSFWNFKGEHAYAQRMGREAAEEEILNPQPKEQNTWGFVDRVVNKKDIVLPVSKKIPKHAFGQALVKLGPRKPLKPQPMQDPQFLLGPQDDLLNIATRKKTPEVASGGGKAAAAAASGKSGQSSEARSEPEPDYPSPAQFPVQKAPGEVNLSPGKYHSSRAKKGGSSSAGKQAASK